MLKKKAPSWNKEHTKAFKALKQVAHNPLPLKIPSTRKKILQTNASDMFWGAILMKEYEKWKKITLLWEY